MAMRPERGQTDEEMFTEERSSEGIEAI